MPAGEVYAAVEAPKGEAMDFLSRGHRLADVSAIIGSLDIVFGSLSTKKIKGLHENDFILASKIDRMLDGLGHSLDRQQ